MQKHLHLCYRKYTIALEGILLFVSDPPFKVGETQNHTETKYYNSMIRKSSRNIHTNDVLILCRKIYEDTMMGTSLYAIYAKLVYLRCYEM